VQCVYLDSHIYTYTAQHSTLNAQCTQFNKYTRSHTHTGSDARLPTRALGTSAVCETVKRKDSPITWTDMESDYTCVTSMLQYRAHSTFTCMSTRSHTHSHTLI
jgi:hypothetical protein